MKILPKLTMSLLVVASVAASAAALTPQEDQARRDRNVDEALAAYRASPQYPGARDGTATPKTKTQRAEQTVRGKTHRAADSVRGFTHRQAQKARDFGARQNARYGKQSAPNTQGEAGARTPTGN